jgi:hypothetical protein
MVLEGLDFIREKHNEGKETKCIKLHILLKNRSYSKTVSAHAMNASRKTEV